MNKVCLSFQRGIKLHHGDDALLQCFLKQSFYPADILVPYASLPHFFFAVGENIGSSCSVVWEDLSTAGDDKGKHCLISTRGHGGCQQLPSPWATLLLACCERMRASVISGSALGHSSTNDCCFLPALKRELFLASVGLFTFWFAFPHV